MARTNQAELDRIFLVGLHHSAQAGTDYVQQQLKWTSRVVSDLLRERFPGERQHKHSEPYDDKDCGWCSNIRSWRMDVARNQMRLPLAERIEEQVRELARTRTQTQTWADVQALFPAMRRELVRDLWHRAKRVMAEGAS